MERIVERKGVCGESLHWVPSASLSAMECMEENRTPWAGGFERVYVYAYVAWIVVLALIMIRRSLSQSEAPRLTG